MACGFAISSSRFMESGEMKSRWLDLSAQRLELEVFCGHA
jgi:hypothetical protein